MREVRQFARFVEKVTCGKRVAMSYIRPATVLEDNATEGLGDDE